jgi:hypothetical protein
VVAFVAASLVDENGEEEECDEQEEESSYDADGLGKGPLRTGVRWGGGRTIVTEVLGTQAQVTVHLAQALKISNHFSTV